MATAPIIINAPASFKSAVWGKFVFFKDSNRKKVVCRLCNLEMCYSGNTTNMATHLRRHHSTIHVQPQSQIVASSSSTIPTTAQQTKITTFSGTSKITITKKSQINAAILEFLVDDLRPFRLVQSVKFRNLLSLLEPQYTVPSRQYFSETMLPLLYESHKTLVINELREADSMAITTDGWTSRATESYVTVTAQFIDKSWDMRSYVLQTRRMDTNHTSVNIAIVLLSCVEEWGLRKKNLLPALVSDNAANMVAAAREGNFNPFVRCFAHTLNLAAQRGLKVNAVSNLLAKIRRIVAFFHKSTVAATTLKEKQKLLGIPAHKLKIDVCTRWNSAYDMVERYLEQQAAVYAALLSTKDLRKRERDITALTDSDIENAESVVVTMRQLKVATLALCTEEGPTLSLVIPLLQKCDEDHGLIKNMKDAISSDLLNRYTDITDFLKVATSLDPRFKNLPFMTDEQKVATFEHLQTMVEDSANLCRQVKQEAGTQEIIEGTAETEGQAQQVQRHGPPEPSLPSLPDGDLPLSTEVSPSKSPPHKKKALDELLGDVFIERIEPPKNTPLKDTIASEIERYKDEPMISLRSDPLMWWKEHSIFFPHVAVVTRSILAIPATSVPSERVFSTTGDILTAQRSSLKSKYVDMMVFLKKNMP